MRLRPKSASPCALTCWGDVKKNLGIKRNSYEILQILSVSLFNKTLVFKVVFHISRHY